MILSELHFGQMAFFFIGLSHFLLVSPYKRTLERLGALLLTMAACCRNILTAVKS